MKILIVEDSNLIRDNLRKFISEMKGVCISGEAIDSKTAIELIEEKNPDVIILDIELKNSSGFDVLKFVKSSECPYNPIVIMFSNYSSLYKEKSFAGKADYFFDKTNELDKFLATLKELQGEKNCS